MNDDQLDQLLHALPREKEPPSQLWSGVASQMARVPERRWPAVVSRVAAALVLFAAGAGAGAYATMRNTVRADIRKQQAAQTAAATSGADATSAPSVFLASLRVQETGSAYVAALVNLDAQMQHARARGQEVALAQGKEVVNNTLEIARQSASSR